MSRNKFFKDVGTPDKPTAKQKMDEVEGKIDEYYLSIDKADKIKRAQEEDKHRSDTTDVAGLCRSCANLRYVKTKLGLRDRFWCNVNAIRAFLPGGLLEVGDEVKQCPYYVQRIKPGEMNLREMFTKAILIDIKTYEPGSDEDAKRGITYL